MLMTVLKGDLAISQSRSLIRLFKQMKDYLIESRVSIDQKELTQLTIQNVLDIAEIKKSMATKEDLTNFMNNFMDNHIGRELLFMDGETVESDVAYANIYSQAKKTIYIIDNYIGIKSLILLKEISKGVKITIFSDNLGKKITKAEYQDFKIEYPSINIDLKITNNKFHDRFVILDFGEETYKIYHCGGSSKDGGLKTTVISQLLDKQIFAPMIYELQKNKPLVLK